MRAYEEAHGNVIAGGLHIVIEDENVADEHIQWCLDDANLDPDLKAVSHGHQLPNRRDES